MIPKLYPADATSFNTLGITGLPDAESCEVTEERNGAYELTMSYPVTGYGFSELQVGRLIVAKPNDISKNQAFEIYQIDKPMNGLCKIKAEHISYRLKRTICSPGIGNTRYATKAMEEFLKGWALGDPVPFTFSSNIGDESSAVIRLTLKEPTALRTALAGMKGSVVSLYGGEFEFDNWNVILHKARGNDNGVRIKYGKNLTGLKVTTDISEVYTGLDVYYIDDETGTVTESGLVSVPDNPFAYERVKAIDVSSEFDSAPSQAQLVTYAQSYLARNNAGQIDASVDASFYPLWQTQEYSHLKDLERVSLCDTVTIDHEKLGVFTKAKVVKTVYDVLRERYKNVVIGKPKIRVIDAIQGATKYANYQEF